MRSIWKIIFFGFIIWLFPFFISLLIFPLKETNLAFFWNYHATGYYFNNCGYDYVFFPQNKKRSSQTHSKAIFAIRDSFRNYLAYNLSYHWFATFLFWTNENDILCLYDGYWIYLFDNSDNYGWLWKYAGEKNLLTPNPT